MISRIIFLLVFTAGGYMLGIRQGVPYQGVIMGAGVGILGLILEYLFSRTKAVTIFSGLLGLTMGIIFAKLIYYPIKTEYIP